MLKVIKIKKRRRHNGSAGEKKKPDSFKVQEVLQQISHVVKSCSNNSVGSKLMGIGDVYKIICLP